jgi:hypothetical protein
LAKIIEVKAELERRAAERYAQEQAGYVAKLRYDHFWCMT